MRLLFWVLGAVLALTSLFIYTLPAQAAYHFANFKATPPIHVYASNTKAPEGMTPQEIKAMYNLPASGGSGTIALIGAYDDATAEADLNDFSEQFNLPQCNASNPCFEKHAMSSSITSNSGWNLEETLDIEWAHAIAPKAKILLVEATTQSGQNLLNAVDYATSRPDVVAISMSWGGAEFSDETTLDSHFTSKYGAVFFASSGDNGAGASWPAASPNVIGVGGTTLALTTNNTLSKETAWSGSGGGVSAYEKEPAYQKNYSIPKANGMRAIPDVAYDANPASGYPIIHKGVWETVGGTSAGSPQWAAIAALGKGVNITNFYSDKLSANASNYFRDITSGSNGSCSYFCSARAHYDYVTGLGSPVTNDF